MNRKLIAAIAVLFFSTMVMAQSSQTNDASILPTVKYFENKEGAIRGYDPVAYFNEGKAVKGDPQFTYSWSGSNWYFKDEANKKAFISTPVKYAPQYGGFCAYGTSENHLSPTEAKAFTIVNEKLYLNYSSKVKELWQKDIDKRIEKANAYWPVLVAQQ